MIEVAAAALVGFVVGMAQPDIHAFADTVRKERAPLAAMHAGERIEKDPHDQEREAVHIRWGESRLRRI